MEQQGLGFKTRVIEGVERIGKLGGTFPDLTNFVLQHKSLRGIMQKALGIHRERKFPPFPPKNFSKWWREHKPSPRKKSNGRRKVAYFAGCTARYLFPDVARAVVAVFENNGIEVDVPQQQCCGMPSMLEGDQKLTLEFTRYNVSHLAAAIEAGYDIVCSCPTCGYMLKNVIRVGADRAVLHSKSAKSYENCRAQNIAA
jgi:glycerol-3-phosphate dehydrogenase subunit C